MWDNVALLRGISGVLMAFSVLTVLYGAGHYVVHRPELLPLHSVRLTAVPQRLEAGRVLDVVRSEVKGNFFTVDIEGLRKALQKLPWVRSVSIRRSFPDSLVVEFEEHQPLARWNDAALVNTRGEVFAAETTQELPEFVGIPGSSEEMGTQYEQFSQQLKPLDLKVKQLVLSPRHAWQLKLSNEMVVELGRDELQQRLARFVTVYPYSLRSMRAVTPETGKDGAQAQQGLQVQYVDMRYRNGFAVRMRHGNA